ncbi:class I SAM-dependent methyltransferase [Streptomyces piniterrae]|uniref:Class I SAM-dependent methyltransferase n=1 Tax=Streptomyces piniterrae TaxID=2571125 RepID=A0A4U0MT34_9ACTN|nr:class I SAM-dependent methyltransferase [Streptomyces piniterrae]TJZ44131.1 class I SAM-dependent methyltransferase [Streptomyces piniterrae]
MRAWALRILYEIEHRLPFNIVPSAVPDRDLVAVVEGEEKLPPGKALDLGCGNGRNSVYLARHGWRVTGVELIGHALAKARRTTAAAGVPVNLVQGDATRLSDYGVGTDYTLVVDACCYHAIAEERRDAYAAEVTKAAAPGALMLMVAFAEQNTPGMNVTEEDLRNRFTGWEILDAAPMAPEELVQYFDGPKLAKKTLTNGRYRAWRYRLRRLADAA